MTDNEQKRRPHQSCSMNANSPSRHDTDEERQNQFDTDRGHSSAPLAEAPHSIVRKDDSLPAVVVQPQRAVPTSDQEFDVLLNFDDHVPDPNQPSGIEPLTTDDRMQRQEPQQSPSSLLQQEHQHMSRESKRSADDAGLTGWEGAMGDANPEEDFDDFEGGFMGMRDQDAEHELQEHGDTIVEGRASEVGAAFAMGGEEMTADPGGRERQKGASRPRKKRLVSCIGSVGWEILAI